MLNAPALGRPASITREEIMIAALSLLGPSRSMSSLSLREIARATGMAPNSFYRHFRDLDELSIALIDLAADSLRQIIREARERATRGHGSVVASSIQAFMQQLHEDEKFLHLLLRESHIGSPAYQHAIEQALSEFEQELCHDLIRLAQHRQQPLYAPALTAKAITRLVFTLGASAVDRPSSEHPRIAEELCVMVRMLLAGSQALLPVGPDA